MIPALINLTLQKPDTFVYTFTWTDSSGTPIDLTGCTAQMPISQTYGAPTMLGLSSATITPGGSSLTLGGTAGTIAVTISATDAATLTSGVYSVQVMMSDGVTLNTPVAGKFILQPEVAPWP